MPRVKGTWIAHWSYYNYGMYWTQSAEFRSEVQARIRAIRMSAVYDWAMVLSEDGTPIAMYEKGRERDKS